jgi:hypothetical protein
MDYIRINNDNWDDLNVIYAVLEYYKTPGSSAVNIVLENCETKEIIHRVVAEHQIEWLESKDI